MSLVEIVVSCFLLGTAGVSMLSALTATVSASKYERDHSRAQVWLQSAIEEVQAADRQGCDLGEATVRSAYLQHIRENVVNPPGWSNRQVDIVMPVKVWDGEHYWDPYDLASPGTCFDNQGINVVILGFLSVGLAQVFAIVTRTLPQAAAQAEDARALVGLSIWLPEDLSSTPSALDDGTGSGGLNIDEATPSGCAGSSPGSNLLRARWTEVVGESSVQYIANYRYVAKEAGFRRDDDDDRRRDDHRRGDHHHRLPLHQRDDPQRQPVAGEQRRERGHVRAQQGHRDHGQLDRLLPDARDHLRPVECERDAVDAHEVLHDGRPHHDHPPRARR